MLNQNNFWVCSEGSFSLAEEPSREPSYVSMYQGEVSSIYWYTEAGVYRKSAHWGKVLHCHWPLLQLPKGHSWSKGPQGAHGHAVGDWVLRNGIYTMVVGFCSWKMLRERNALAKQLARQHFENVGNVEALKWL